LHPQNQMYLKNILNLVLAFFLAFNSCKKEDEVEPIRDAQEQALADDESLEDFLSTHFYNYEDFLDPQYKGSIVLDSIQGENSSKTALINQVMKEVVRVKTTDDIFVDHTLYYLIAREGSGIHPAAADSTFLSYEGLLTSKSIFDSSKTPVWFDLTSVVRGFKEGMPKLKSGEFTVKEDNTVEFFNYGQGMIFFPSGMGYFNRTAGTIPAYAPLIFKINLYRVKKTDHDGDGILSADEYDNNNDGIPDDTDEDGIPDYLDAD
jgi:hypothetical protein